jgi:intracellular septation protein
LWTGNFALVGSLNLFVAYRMGEAFWVSYKLYSAIGFTLLLTVITAFMIAPHMHEEDAEASEPVPDND